jgi:TM2 domain-containing membrane protein YozV
MSAIIPGSGKAYSKRWGDAIISFIFVGTNTFAAYRAFSKKGINSTNGWIFGSLAFSFYSANLWGSFKAAKNYNNHIKHSYQQNAENIIYTSF